MKKLMLAIIVTTLQSQAATSVYQYEQLDAIKYAKQTRAQARELDKLADAAEKFNKENLKALDQHKRQELAFSRLRHSEQRLADSRTYIKEYPTYKYDIAVSEAATEIKVVK